MSQRHAYIRVQNLHEKSKCKSNLACLWKSRECIEKPRCADQTKKGKCKKQGGCQWKKGKCAEQSCASHKKKENMQKPGELPVVKEEVPRRLSFARRRSQVREVPKQFRASAGRATSAPPLAARKRRAATITDIKGPLKK